MDVSAAEPEIHSPDANGPKPTAPLAAEPVTVIEEPTNGRGQPHVRAIQLEQLIEAALFVNVGVVVPAQIASSFAGLTVGYVEQVLLGLGERYRIEQRPFYIQRTRDGYTLQIRPDLQAVISKPTRAKLSREALEVLAVVAYRQPIDRRTIEDFWGKDPASPLRSLVKRGLIQIATGTGKSAVYQTTERFLAQVKIDKLTDLPRLSDDIRL